MVMNITQEELDELRMQVESKQMIIDALNQTITGKDEVIVHQKNKIEREKARVNSLKSINSEAFRTKDKRIVDLKERLASTIGELSLANEEFLFYMMNADVALEHETLQSMLTGLDVRNNILEGRLKDLIKRINHRESD